MYVHTNKNKHDVRKITTIQRVVYMRDMIFNINKIDTQNKK